MDNDELQDSPIPEIQIETPVENPTPSETEESTDPYDAITDLDEMRKVAKGERAKATRRNQPPKDKPEKPADKPSQVQPPINEKLIETKVDLRLGGYSKDEIDHMQTYAKGANVTLEEAAKSDFVLSGIENMRTKAKAAAATPPSTPKTVTPTTTDGQPVVKKHKTPQEWKADRQKGKNE